MQPEMLQTISTLLASTDPNEIRGGLALVKSQLPTLAEDEGRDLLEMISALFYIDPLDLPGHVPVIEDAIAAGRQHGRLGHPAAASGAGRRRCQGSDGHRPGAGAHGRAGD